MNAEKFDIEKMLEVDAESIEIDLDFKAKLKANIMKNNSSFEKNNLIDFNSKIIGEDVNKPKDIKYYRKYLKIASSFAIVGLIGFRIGVGNLGFTKVDNPNDINVFKTEVYTVPSTNVATSANDADSADGEEIEGAGKEVEVNQDANTDKDDKKIKESSSDNNVVVEKPKTGEDSELVASVKENAYDDQNETNNPDGEIASSDNVNEDTTKAATGEDHDTMIKKQEDMHFTSPNISSEENDNKNESILVSYVKEEGLDLYYGTLSITEDEEFVIRDNEIYIKNEDSEEKIFTQEDNYQLMGIKKINDNEVLLYKCLLGNEKKAYQLSKLNISSKSEKLLVVEANNIIVNNTYDKLAFEINNNIEILDIKTEKQETALNGKNIAWSPDGKYLSYVKIVKDKDEVGKIVTYSSLVVYNCEENEEKTLAENELIVYDDDKLVGRYEYGENLWSNDDKCIYVVRENISIMIDIDGNQKQVIKLSYEK